MYEGGYHQAERSLIATLVGQGGTVLDVGANIGLITAMCAGLVGEQGHVHAFEPNPPIFERLRATVGASPQVTLHQLALSDRPGTAGLLLEQSHHGATGLQLAEPHDSTVNVSTVDEIVERERVGSVDLLKVDVEGNEERVLRGADMLIQSRRIAHLLVEVHWDSRTSDWLESWLTTVDGDYRVFRVTYEPSSLGFRRVPRLVEGAWRSLGPSSFNLLVSRRDRLRTAR